MSFYFLVMFWPEIGAALRNTNAKVGFGAVTGAAV
jgi:hypothetical protein